MYLHIDMDYFFAQIEEKRRPMLKDKIIAVCVFSGRTEDSGVISTVNYPGRALGIKSGMPIATAKKKAPPADSIFLPVDREAYTQASMFIDGIIRKGCDKVVQASIDEWHVEDSDAIQKAPKIKEEIEKKSGLTCSIGVAPSLLGAKMGASKCKPDGLLILDKESEEKLISGSDVEKVPGIGKKTGEALRALGALKIQDISKIDPGNLVETFGRKTGSWLHELSLGEYKSELGEEKEQEEVSRIGTLKMKTRDSYILLEKLSDLEPEAKEWLMEKKKSYKTLTIIFITEDLRTHTKSTSFSHPLPWNSSTEAEKKKLIEEFLSENPMMIRRIGIRFGNFLDLGGQTTLF